MTQGKFKLLFSYTVFLILFSCTSTPVNTHKISKIVPTTLKVRRPLSPGADPHAGPGGVDYKSTPLPDKKLDCDSISSIYKNLPLDKILACFPTLDEPMDVIYHLIREPLPYFLLEEEEEETPECLKKFLREIPIPREIIFQAPTEEKGKYLCYSSRLDIEAEHWMDVHLPKNRLDLVLHLPIKNIPKNKEEVLSELTRFSLAPFLQGEFFHAKILTDSLCRVCIGDRDQVKKEDLTPIFWP